MADSILEIGKSALETNEMKVKALMNNVANAQTPGYKKSDVITSSFPMYLQNATKALEERSSYVFTPKVVGTFNKFQNGAIFKTGSNTDFAIGGDGYFVVLSDEGEVFTRDGRFYINEQGLLVTATGNFLVSGQSGPISVPFNSKFEINKNGAVLIDDVEVDRIRVVKILDPSKLESLNNSFFKAPKEGIAYEEVVAPTILQGYLESSNVSIIDEMTNLITTQRSYELATKIIKNREADLQKIIEIGRPAQ